MQPGDIIIGASGQQFALEKSLGQPGLIGQVYLGHRVDNESDQARYAIKTLRPDRPADDKERFFQEAETLRKMEAVETPVGVHYAVRLIDQARPMQTSHSL